MEVPERLASWVVDRLTPLEADRPPTRLDWLSAVSTGAVFVILAIQFDYTLLPIAVGFVVTTVLFGPVVRWIEGRSPLVRGLSLILAVGLVLGTLPALSEGFVSPDTAVSALAGGMLSMNVLLVVQTLAAREDGAVTETA